MEDDTETTPVPAPATKSKPKVPRTPAQMEATRKALAALAEKRKALDLAPDTPAVRQKMLEEKLRKQAVARAVIEGVDTSVKSELAEIKLMLAERAMAEKAATVAAVAAKEVAEKPAKSKRRVRVVEEESSSEEEVVVVRRKSTRARDPPTPAPAPAPAPAPPPPPPAPPAIKPTRPKLDPTLFSR
jgi:hypothetical protein